MALITARLHRLIDDQKKKMERLEKRIQERCRAALAAHRDKETSLESKEEEETKRRRRVSAEKSFRGCTEEEAEEDLLEIYNGVKADKYLHIQPDGKTTTIIKKNKITEGDIVRIEKGEAYEIGFVKCISKGVLILESRDKEKKYPLQKLLSSRYSIVSIGQK